MVCDFIFFKYFGDFLIGPCIVIVSVDPYVAAEIFLETNHLPAYYLDQVAEFIIKNAGEFQGEVAARGGDPFTGEVLKGVQILLHYC